MSNLVDHARRELQMLGEDPETTEGLVKVVEAFAAMGHSGGSAMACIPVLEQLLRYRPLTPITTDPAEWIDYTRICGGVPTWQNTRNSEAFSSDGGKTHWLLSERDAVPLDDLAPIHLTLTPEDARMVRQPDVDLDADVEPATVPMTPAPPIAGYIAAQ